MMVDDRHWQAIQRDHEARINRLRGGRPKLAQTRVPNIATARREPKVVTVEWAESD